MPCPPTPLVDAHMHHPVWVKGHMTRMTPQWDESVASCPDGHVTVPSVVDFFYLPVA